MIFAPYIQPVAEPVSLAEMKIHLRIDTTSTADDELIKVLIKTARQWAESYERKSYMIRSNIIYLDSFPDSVELPYSPIISVDSIQYVDSDGVTQTLATTVYTADVDSVPGRIYLAYSQTWPSIRDIEKAITITYKSGYATTFTAVAATDVCTVGNAVFANTDLVRIYSDANDLPAGLLPDTNYYVRDVSGSTLKLALTSGGTAIDITDTGTGTHYIAFADTGFVPERVRAAIKLLTAHFYEHREQVGELTLKETPFAVKHLLFERVF